MEKKEENRSRWLNIRLKQGEYNSLEKEFKKTAYRKMSEYGRALLFGKPVTVMHRDKSMDELLEELVLLRRELNAIGNNLNQAVRNINGAHGHADSWLWMNLLVMLNRKLLPLVTQIKLRMDVYANVWSQKLKAGKA